jgi:hypothetical protein
MHEKGATLPSGYTTTICLFGPGSWSGFDYPSDWLWSYATIDFLCGSGVVGLLGQPVCGGAASRTGGGLTATWAYGGSTPYDITITIY